MTTKAAAILGSLLLGSSYVAAVHVSSLSVPQSRRRRDSSQVILRRICGVVAHSVLSVAATCHFGGLSVSKLGLWISVNESVQVWRDRLLLPVLGAGVLTLVLFAGQIAQAALNQEALFHVALSAPP
ncbi:hypothetical protein HDU99_008769 [Rhizoclosmatium hyalinum]|nr:hypothetical protein HDU99_008769 [Rhizoclosmatium hyalinum]